MSEPPLATSKTPTTRKEQAKFVTIMFRDGIREQFTLYTDVGDRLGANELLLELHMTARPDAPSLQRPLEERITAYKVNILWYSVISAEVDVDIVEH